MAYLHCHTKGCGWSQDDFWSFRVYWMGGKLRMKYNPIQCFISYVFGYRGYWKPRRIRHDQYFADEVGWERNDPHSWYLIWFQFKRMIRKFRTQTWWSYDAWLKDKDTAVCPRCGLSNFDID